MWGQAAGSLSHTGKELLLRRGCLCCEGGLITFFVSSLQGDFVVSNDTRHRGGWKVVTAVPLASWALPALSPHAGIHAVLWPNK